MNKNTQTAMKKLEKYQQKLAMCQNNPMERNVYKYKIKQYTSQLQSGGMDNKLLESIIAKNHTL